MIIYLKIEINNYLNTFSGLNATKRIFANKPT